MREIYRFLGRVIGIPLIVVPSMLGLLSLTDQDISKRHIRDPNMIELPSGVRCERLDDSDYGRGFVVYSGEDSIIYHKNGNTYKLSFDEGRFSLMGASRLVSYCEDVLK